MTRVKEVGMTAFGGGRSTSRSGTDAMLRSRSLCMDRATSRHTHTPPGTRHGGREGNLFREPAEGEQHPGLRECERGTDAKNVCRCFVKLGPLGGYKAQVRVPINDGAPVAGPD